MMYKIIFCFLLGLIYFSACSSGKHYTKSPKEIEQAVKEYFIRQDDQLDSVSVSKESDEIYPVIASSKEGEGWGLVAQKIQQDGQVIWKIDRGTAAKLKELGLRPEY